LADLFPRSELEVLADPALRRGIELHRSIDRETDVHPRVRAVRERFPSEIRRGSGIVLDVIWDHFLSCEFEQRTGLGLRAYLADLLAGLERWVHLAPTGTRSVLEQMRDEDWLGSYGTPAGVELALIRISRRLSLRARRTLAPATARAFLSANYSELKLEFDQIWRDVSAAVRDTR
jgi:acyl carrier protein phosphodiesterase